jgi:hypothetical protein
MKARPFQIVTTLGQLEFVLSPPSRHKVRIFKLTIPNEQLMTLSLVTTQDEVLMFSL